MEIISLRLPLYDFPELGVPIKISFI